MPLCNLIHQLELYSKEEATVLVGLRQQQEELQSKLKGMILLPALNRRIRVMELLSVEKVIVWMDEFSNKICLYMYNV